MKKSEKNLAVIENFILHLTHSSEGDPIFKVPQTYTPEELYRVAYDYIKENSENYQEQLSDLNKKEINKNGIIFLGVALQFNGSTIEEIDAARKTFDFGTLRLKKGDKEIILDSSLSTLEDNYTIFVKLEEHTSLAEEDKDCKQDLTDFSNLDIAELYIGQEYDIEPDSITLFVVQGETTITIDLTKD